MVLEGVVYLILGVSVSGVPLLAVWGTAMWPRGLQRQHRLGECEWCYALELRRSPH